MRRKCLLSVAMFAVLLATSACGAGTPAQESSPQPGGYADDRAGNNSNAEASSNQGPEVGISQLNAAEALRAAKAKSVAAAKVKSVAADAQAAGKGATAKATAATKKASKGTAAKKASKATAAKKVSKGAAAKKASKATAAKKRAVGAAAKTPPAAVHGLKRAVPVPVVPKRAPTPVLPSSEKSLQAALTSAYPWYDSSPEGSATASHPVLHQTAGATGSYPDAATLAVGYTFETGEDALDVPPGTRVSLPDVRRYFIVEDTCGDGDHQGNDSCPEGHEAHSAISVDM
ncbi:hypothetical protein [uncultured Arthrobacter sp.]|uniref:hypothetical protein n=1 Tax=uncultured Arthrobacter sp. TaxID=114050 RepID=UPI0028D1DF8F|nr:hypothetical protein [uncultured Arthrobacter sp.]